MIIRMLFTHFSCYISIIGTEMPNLYKWISGIKIITNNQMHINCDLTFDRLGKFSHYFKEYDAALLRLASNKNKR